MCWFFMLLLDHLILDIEYGYCVALHYRCKNGYTGSIAKFVEEGLLNAI